MSLFSNVFRQISNLCRRSLEAHFPRHVRTRSCQPTELQLLLNEGMFALQEATQAKVNWGISRTRSGEVNLYYVRRSTAPAFVLVITEAMSPQQRRMRSPYAPTQSCTLKYISAWPQANSLRIDTCATRKLPRLSITLLRLSISLLQPHKPRPPQLMLGKPGACFHLVREGDRTPQHPRCGCHTREHRESVFRKL